MAEVKVDDGNGCSLTFLEMNGFRYPPFPADVVSNLPDLPIRRDDVIVCAYPKSGTHWVWEMVRQLLSLKTSGELGNLPLREKDDGMVELTSQAELDRLTSPRVLNTHVYFDQLPSQIKSTGCRIVRLVRDPRDVAVSYFHHHRKLTDLYHYHGQWDHYLPLFLSGQLDYGSWFDYHLSWERGLQDYPDLTVLTMSYEDIKQDTENATRRLARFLGVDCGEETVQAVVRTCSFDHMRQIKGPLETDTTGSPIMYRKGRVGDWKTVFTVAQAEMFARVYRNKVQALVGLTSQPGAATAKPLDLPLAATYVMETCLPNNNEGFGPDIASKG